MLQENAVLAQKSSSFFHNLRKIEQSLVNPAQKLSNLEFITVPLSFFQKQLLQLINNQLDVCFF